MKLSLKPPLRVSPIYTELQQCSGEWQDINQMHYLIKTSDAQKATQLGIADLSYLNRFGIKGAAAATWLDGQNILILAQPNCWCPLTEESSEGGIVARLGANEFLAEDSLQTAATVQLREASRQLPEKVYPVLRQDLAIALSGQAVHELLLQICNVNFRALSLSEHPVVLTSMIGVSVTVIPGMREGLPFYRVWCDGIFYVYIWQTLVQIINESGGSVVGTGRWL